MFRCFSERTCKKHTSESGGIGVYEPCALVALLVGRNLSEPGRPENAHRCTARCHQYRLSAAPGLCELALQRNPVPKQQDSGFPSTWNKPQFIIQLLKLRPEQRATWLPLRLRQALQRCQSYVCLAVTTIASKEPAMSVQLFCFFSLTTPVHFAPLSLVSRHTYWLLCGPVYSHVQQVAQLLNKWMQFLEMLTACASLLTCSCRSQDIFGPKLCYRLLT